MYVVMLLLLSHFSRVQLCATPWTAAHQAPLSLGFSRREHWSGLPVPSPVHESEKWKWSRSVCLTRSNPMDCSLPGSSTHGIFQARALEWGAIAFSAMPPIPCLFPQISQHRFFHQTFTFLWNSSYSPFLWNCPFKIKPSEDPNVKSLISCIP